MTSKKPTQWHDEGGKLHLCESLVSEFNRHLACPECCKHLTTRLPLAAQATHAFIRNQGGRAPKDTVRRVWSCRVAKSPNRILACRSLGVTDMLQLCFTQLTVSQFDWSVRQTRARYDVDSPQNAALKDWVIKHQQRLDQPLSPSPTAPIHVKPAKIDLTNDAPAAKRKAVDPTGATPTKTDRHSRTLEKARDVFIDSPLDVFVDSPLLPRQLPLHTNPNRPRTSLVQQAVGLQDQITQCMSQLVAYHAQLGPILQSIQSDSASPVTPTRSSTSDTLPNSPSPMPCGSGATSSTIAFTPPGKSKSRKPVEVTWIYAGCLLPEPDGMSPKEMHDSIIQEAAKVYGPEDLSHIIWARQLDDDDWTVELAVYKADVDRLYDIWAARFRPGSIRLDLHDHLRDLHNPRYWQTFVACTLNPDGPEARTLIRQHDTSRLAQAWVGCQSRMVKTYLRRLSEEWQEQDLFYSEVGICREASQHGTKLPGQP